MAKNLSGFFFFSFILIHLLALSINAQPEFLIDTCPNDSGNYTTNSTYQANLNTILSSISTGIDSGFYNDSFGQAPNRVNAIVLCRGDVSLDVCQGCVRNATRKIFQNCPNQMEAVGWYDECMIRYSNKSILGVVDTGLGGYLWNQQNVSDNLVDEFNQELQSLLTSLRNTAASGNSLLKFATGNTTVNFQPVYALVQCTPDLSKTQCTECLDEVIKQIPACCQQRIGGRVLMPSCNFRFESNDLFFNPTPDSPPPSPLLPPPAEPPVEGNNNNTARTVIIIVVPVAWKNWRGGTTMNLIDPSLTSGSRTEMIRCIHIGLLCVQENVASRPTMSSVVLMLNSYSLTLPVPSEPAFFMHSTISDMSSSVAYSSSIKEADRTKNDTIPLTANEASITDLYPR
ncbi:hypothetical protein Patl1_10999 [Pistacia atlantica]|uniref:Uncharacterized protein n=1 Tax=Pistacia atlantica TaxID=434234 RepID=A0ACC1A374_9ROSI|nr:hypothetical protein Patl1_10999 [Pistacia atlantica]